MPAEQLARYRELHDCEHLGEDVLACVETVSTSSRRRGFGKRSRTTRIVAAVTPTHLVWATGSGEDAAVAAARLSGLETREYRSTLIEDSGVELVGFQLGAAERGSWFLPLDEGPDAAEFREQLQRAIGAVR
jgi:hypothetical protein